MPFPSAIPGAAGSTPGAMLLAVAPQAASYIVEWEGPFSRARARFITDSWWEQLLSEGDTATVSLKQQDSLAASDPVWWVIVG